VGIHHRPVLASFRVANRASSSQRLKGEGRFKNTKIGSSFKKGKDLGRERRKLKELQQDGTERRDCPFHVHLSPSNHKGNGRGSRKFRRSKKKRKKKRREEIGQGKGGRVVHSAEGKESTVTGNYTAGGIGG